MPLHPPSTLYDRIEGAGLLSEMERAQLTALAEEVWAQFDLRASRPEKLAMERAFWSLVSEWEGMPPVLIQPKIPDGAILDRILLLEEQMGETILGISHPSTPVADLESLIPDEEVLFDFPRQMARRFGVFPVRKQERLVELASSTPRDWRLWLELSKATAWRIRLLSAPVRDIERAIKRYYPDARDPTPQEPLRMLFSVHNSETLQEDGFDIEFSIMPELRLVCGDLIGRMLAEGIDSLVLEPIEGSVQLNIFTDSWRPLTNWPLNLWRPLDLAFRKMAKLQPWEQEGFMNWPFMGADYRIWLLWQDVRNVPTLTIQPMLAEDE